MRGLKNKNVDALEKRFQIKSLEIVPDTSLAEDKLTVPLRRLSQNNIPFHPAAYEIVTGSNSIGTYFRDFLTISRKIEDFF